jgi:hypothetical protein
MPKRIQLPDDFYKHDFKQLAKIEKHPRTRIRFIGLSHIQNGKSGLFGVVFKGRLFKYISIHSCKFHQSCFSITPKDSIPLI